MSGPVPPTPETSLAVQIADEITGWQVSSGYYGQTVPYDVAREIAEHLVDGVLAEARGEAARLEAENEFLRSDIPDERLPHLLELSRLSRFEDKWQAAEAERDRQRSRADFALAARDAALSELDDAEAERDAARGEATQLRTENERLADLAFRFEGEANDLRSQLADTQAQLAAFHVECDNVGIPHDAAGLVRHHRGNGGMVVAARAVAAEARLKAVKECAADFAALPSSNWTGRMVADTFRAALLVAPQRGGVKSEGPGLNADPAGSSLASQPEPPAKLPISPWSVADLLAPNGPDEPLPKPDRRSSLRGGPVPALPDPGEQQPDETPAECYRPCAGCDSVSESCRAVRCPAVAAGPVPQPTRETP